MTREDLLTLFADGKRDFRGADLRGIRLVCDVSSMPSATKTMICLDGIDLASANLSGATIGKCSLVGANLAGADLTSASLISCDLTEANLAGATLWRRDSQHSSVLNVTLKRANLRGAELTYTNFLSSDLTQASLDGADLQRAFCQGVRFLEARLVKASLLGADLEFADLTRADCSGADFKGANLKRAILIDANFSSAYLKGTNLYNAKLDRTKFAQASFDKTVLASLDLGSANLSNALHHGSSAVSQETLQLTAASLARHQGNHGEVETFFKGCGVEQHLIEYFRSMIGKPLEFYSAFISYSHSDRSFAKLLHDSLQAQGIRCWLDEHDLKPGDRILDVVDQAIRVTDKLLLCCSQSSLESWWVKDEIRKAIERERRDGRDIVIPLMLDRYLVDEWQDGLASDVRSRFAPDFGGWTTDHAVFQCGFDRVLDALRSTNRSG